MCLQGDKQPGSNLPSEYLLQILKQEKTPCKVNDLVVNGRMENIPIALGESMIGDHALLQYSAASSFSRVLNFLCFLSRK